MDTKDFSALEKMLRDSVALHNSPSCCPLSAKWRIGLPEVDVQNRRFTFSFHAEEDMRNPVNCLHGGMSAGMLDTAMGIVACCFTRDGQPAFTAELDISYLQPVRLPSEPHIAVTLLRAGGHLINLRADLFDPAAPETLLATAKGTFYGK